jgi:membrane fusion protein (multidrug efflux system)
MWVIASGLQPGDRVVVEGFSRVKSGAKVKPTEAPADEVAGGPEGKPATTPGTAAGGK